jgi:hypothetical protein
VEFAVELRAGLLWNFGRASFQSMNDLPRNEQARRLWARTKFHIWPERYWLVSLDTGLTREAAVLLASHPKRFAALIRERDEVSLTIAERPWRRSRLRRRAKAESGPFKAITFDIPLDLDVVGYMAPATARLATAGISIVPQCAFRKDHLLVPADKAVKALRALRKLVRDCRRPVRRTGSRATGGRRRRAARA